MAEQFPLPPSVESLIQQICHEQSQPLPDSLARQELASLGEEASLRLLTYISRSKINRTFSGFIMYLARQQRSPASPGKFASPPPPPSPAGVVLPAAVEELIGSICRDQSQPPLGLNAKRKLESLGEEEALRLLNSIHRSKITKSFDGFVLHLVKSESPSPASPRQESIFSSPSYAPSSAASLCSPNSCDLDEVTSLLQDRLTLASVPTDDRQPGGQTFLTYEGKFSAEDRLTMSPVPTARQPGGKIFSPYGVKSSVQNRLSFSPVKTAMQPGGQTFLPYEAKSSVQDRLTPSPVPTARRLGGQTFLHCMNNKQFNEHGPSPATNVKIPDGHTPYFSTSIGSPNGQFMGSPRNILTPNAHDLVPSMYASKPNGLTLNPCTTVGKPNGQCPASSENVLMPNAHDFAPSMNAWRPNEQFNEHTPSPATNVKIPDGQFLGSPRNILTPDAHDLVPSMYASKPNGLTLNPCTTLGKPNGQCPASSENVLMPSAHDFAPSMNAWRPYEQFNEHTPSPATNVKIPDGHTPYFLTSIGSPNGQFMGSPRNILTPYAHDLVPSMYASKPNGLTLDPCTTVGKPNGQCPASSENVLMPNAYDFAPSMNAWRPNGQTLIPTTSNGKPNEQCLMRSINVSMPNPHALVPSMNAWKPGEQSGHTSRPVLQALHELEFRKGFLILTYLGRNRNKLEEVTSPSEIKSLAVQSMGVFENIIWNRFGSRFCEMKDRIKHIDWESGRRYNYHCYVYSDGSYSLKGPFLNKTATLLQKVLGDENVLMVKFYSMNGSSENANTSVLYSRLHTVAEDGIFVGLKCFRFFVFKDGGKEEKLKAGSGPVKSYFVSVDAFARFYENKASCLDVISMHDRRCIFMHVHNVSRLPAYMARFSLILSKTITLEVDLDDPDVLVEVIEDVPCKDENGMCKYDQDGKLQIHTDGTGFISEELARKCPRNCFKGSSPDDEFLERYLDTVRHGNTSTGQFKLDMLQPPLLIQFRMFYKGLAVKGTVLLNKKLQGKKIQIRPSMIKVEPDQGISPTAAVNSFEIVTTSSRPRKPRLSQNLIALLHYGGVPRDFFMNLLVNELWHAHNSLSRKSAALKVAVMNGDIDDNYTVARMILSGIPLDEPYIQLRMAFFVEKELSEHLKKGKFPLDDSFYVMGTADPTDSLKSNEVCVIHETGQIEGDVLVYRNPGVHFGDVHILKAIRVEAIEEFVGTSKYGIFFPTNGPRSLADKMAGGDFDGDTFLVSRHPMLLTTFKQSEPWTPTPIDSPSTSLNKKPSEFTAEQLEHVLFQQFLTTRFNPSASAGHAANNWLCYMDQLLSSDEQKDDKLCLENKMRRLVDIYYEALDAPKKGKKVIVPPDLDPPKFPHYMGKSKHSYKSTSVLGEIFDKVDEFNLEAPLVQVRKLPCFDIEVPLRCMAIWEDHYKSYRKEMDESLKSNTESKNTAANDVIQKYKQMLYGADEFEKSPRSWEEIRFDALALYHAVYAYAMQQYEAKKCGVAWKVAGPALMKIYMEEQDEKPILCLPSVLREVL